MMWDRRRLGVLVVALVVFGAVYVASSWQIDEPITSAPSMVAEQGGEPQRGEQPSSRRHTDDTAATAAPAAALTAPEAARDVPEQSRGIYWPELGNAGWRRPSRVRGESSAWTCVQARAAIDDAYAAAAKANNLNGSPRFGMTGFFHEPHPLCGAVLLRHLHGTLDNVPVLRISEAGRLHAGNNRRQSHGDDDDDATLNNPASINQVLLGPKHATGLREFRDTFGGLDLSREVLDVVAGTLVENALTIEECGDGIGFSHVLYTARLVSYNFIAPATVSRVDGKQTGRSVATRVVSFVAPAPGTYVLEVKIVHANGTSDNPRVPRSLGVIGTRANIGGRKAFMYNARCDELRHVAGSPLLVRAHASPPSSSSAAVPASQAAVTPLCTRGDYQHGFWVRIAQPSACHRGSNPFCSGDPGWVTDASAYNTEYVWVPSERRVPLLPACKYNYVTPPHGPANSCLRHSQSRAFLYLVGDSVIREYAKNCELLSLRAANLQCLFANIALEGQHFSNPYADSVAKTIVTNVRENNAGVFATNLGLQHMIGPCTTKQWRIFVRYFVLHWKQQIVWARGAPRRGGAAGNASNTAAATAGAVAAAEADGVLAGHGGEADVADLTIAPSPGQQSQGGRASESDDDDGKLKRFYYNDPKFPLRAGEYPKLEQAIWVGPPTIQYARKGMGAERAALWDSIAWRELEPLGFHRLSTMPVTATRQEATWDGLHYASERNKVQTLWRNKAAPIYRWSGGVANTLFTLLLNLVCNRPAVL